MIDTPGFDDTFRTDTDILKDIAFWLNTSYKANVKLSGVVYLHPIDKNRMTGSAHKNLRMFQKLCGSSSLPSVVLATTMWENIKEEDGVAREAQLKTRPDFWGNMVLQGSHVFRHTDNKHSAMNIINYVLDQRKTTVLEIQRQMVDEGKNLDETSAGQELERELLQQRELFERRLKEAERDMQEAIAEGNRKAIEEAAEQQARFQKKFNEALKGSEKLKITMEKLLQQKEVEYRKAVQELKAEQERSQQVSKETSKIIVGLQKKMQVRDEEADEDRRRYRKEMEELSDRYSKQNIESQLSFQKWISDQESVVRKRYSQPPPPPTMSYAAGPSQNIVADIQAAQTLTMATANALNIVAAAGACTIM